MDGATLSFLAPTEKFDLFRYKMDAFVLHELLICHAYFLPWFNAWSLTLSVYAYLKLIKKSAAARGAHHVTKQVELQIIMLCVFDSHDQE